MTWSECANKQWTGHRQSEWYQNKKPLFYLQTSTLSHALSQLKLSLFQTLNKYARLKAQAVRNPWLIATWSDPSQKKQCHYTNISIPKKNNSSRTKKGALIPHYVGVCGTPKFPVTTDYAKHQLIVHKPWRSYPTSDDWIAEFNCYINSPDASITAKLTYQRVHARFLSNTQHCQPTADTYDHSKNPIDCSDKELLDLLGIHNPAEGEIDDSILQHLDKGINFNWDKTPKVSHQLY